MRMLTKSVMALGLAALMTTPVMAQQRRGGGGGFGRGGVTMLLGNASVQEELKMDDAQKDKARELGEKAREKFTAARDELQNLSQEERSKKMREMMEESNKEGLAAAKEILKPEQAKRLHEINLQVSGANAFENNKHLQEKLAITDEQKTAIASILESSNQETREIFQGAATTVSAMEKIRDLRKKTLEDVKGKLTDDQKTKYTALLGSPFEIKYERPGGNR